MSYFSKEATNKYYEDDFSYPSAEMQLQWRLDELKMRYEELSDEDFAYNNPLIFMENDLRYILPTHLYSMQHIKKAIKLAEFDLREKYGIEPYENIKSTCKKEPPNKNYIQIAVCCNLLNRLTVK